MRKTVLINKISSKEVVQRKKDMQVLDETSESYFNFINSLKSESTRNIYKLCLEKFLTHNKIDLVSLLKLSHDELTNLIIKHLVEKKFSNQYKNLISATLKHACEINDVILNWKKIKRKVNDRPPIMTNGYLVMSAEIPTQYTKHLQNHKLKIHWKRYSHHLKQMNLFF